MHKIIWAADAFETDDEIQSHLVSIFKELQKSLKAEIEPVYVLSPDQLNLPVELSPLVAQHYQTAAQNALVQRIKGLPIQGLLPPQVIVQHQSSLQSSADLLCHYALTHKAHSIVVGTHGRKGLARLFLGSFAETILLKSKIPVFVVNPASQVDHSLKHLLFPTDLLETSLSALPALFSLARDLKAKVTLFHVMPRPVEQIIQSGIYLLGGGWVPLPEFYEMKEPEKRKLAEDAIKKVPHPGIEIKIVIDRDSRNATESILEYAKNHQVDLLAIPSQSGPISAALLGSVTRQLTRTSTLPLWIIKTSL